MAEALVRMEHISKFFGRVQALDDVNFTRRAARRSSDCSATTGRASRR